MNYSAKYLSVSETFLSPQSLDYAGLSLELVQRVQLHPSIFRKAQLHPSIFGKKSIMKLTEGILELFSKLVGAIVPVNLPV